LKSYIPTLFKDSSTIRLISFGSIPKFSGPNATSSSTIVATICVEGLIVGVVNQLKVKAAEEDISLLFEFENEFIENIQGDKNRL
ncbi:hypothetical protein ACTPEM_24160, partial [Clostridioides difficile]